MARIDQIAIVGPTAAGKSRLGLALAGQRPIEIIAADSRTVYRGLNIGTAKPTPADQALVRHHMIDVAGPGEDFNVFRFQQQARAALKKIKTAGRLPVIIGGSGLYLTSLVYGYQFQQQAGGHQNRQSAFQGWSVAQLQALIKKRRLLLPDQASNRRRLIRVLESNQSQPPTQTGLAANSRLVGLRPPPAVLDQNLKARARAMVKAGVVAEAVWAHHHYPADSEALKSNIYRCLKPHLDQQISLQTALDNFLVSERRLVKKQLTWFKRYPEIVWFDQLEPALAYLLDQGRP